MQKITWSQIEADINDLCFKILNNNDEKADNIIAVGRGGLIAATLIAYKLNISKIHNYGVSSYTQSNEPGNITEYQLPNFSLLKDKKTLLVDDLSDKGTTLRYVTDSLQKQNIKHTVCTLYIKESTSFKPDFYSKTFPDNVWILFPWDV
jgi:hypoxanthine phosphoribosyltransferase